MQLTKSALSFLPKFGGDRENSLDNYLTEGFANIDGWLHEPALQVTLAIGRIQAAQMAPGPVCEIGVWQGRYLALLSFLGKTAQPIIGVDMFTHVPDRDMQIGRLYKNINAFFRRPQSVRIIQKNSRDVSAEELISAGGGKFNFISVDGDHTMPGCLHDLKLATRIAASGGVVAVDDIFNPTCPGVIEAVMRYCIEPTAALAPFAIVGNKLFMTQAGHCESYRQGILNQCAAGELGASSRPILDFEAQMQVLQIGVDFMGQKVLVHP